MLRDLLQEMRELGVRGTAFRVGWELRQRSGVAERLVRAPAPIDPDLARGDWIARLPFADPDAVARAMAERMPAERRAHLAQIADDATRGRILCFGRWVADYGDPIDWHLNPVTRERWNPDAPWTSVLADASRVGDVKLTWEAARFPQAFQIPRAAAFDPASRDRYAAALCDQLAQFTRANPYGRGVHWASGQETVIRLLAWVFALDTLLVRGAQRERAVPLVAEALAAGAVHVADNLPYARYAVFNNHLLAEALGLYAVGVLLPWLEDATAWRALGRKLLVEQAAVQFYADGGYLQLSHNYHRVALHALLWACVLARADGDGVDDTWLAAIDRSARFLVAHQNPADGRLPNFGANDGAMPSVMTTCDFSDFRPALQAANVAVHGERLYEPGPWDEMTAWMFGPSALDLPVRPPVRRSVSFMPSGFHVLRGADEGSFAAFRCGTIHDRFAQIDMLHVDLWWRGLNVLVDGGSYLYNAEEEWHEHFLRTASHNTVTIDGLDQMLHFRRFKNLYWTEATLLGFDDRTVAGEHTGYARHRGSCVHRRTVRMESADRWVVIDEVRGDGEHEVALHWLAGDFPFTYDDAMLRLDTPRGAFTIAVLDKDGRPAAGTVVAGATDPPRGWQARYYGEKRPVPSLLVSRKGALPITLTTVLSAG